MSVHKMKKGMFAVTAISNFARYKRRPELYFRFAEMCREAGINLITVELAQGRRDFEVTNKHNPFHLQLVSVDNFWHKENLLNLGIMKGRIMMPYADSVCWIDADCRPARVPRDWFLETWHMLQDYKIVQMWETMLPLDSYQNPLTTPNVSFMSNYIKYGTPYPKKEADGYPLQWGSPGLAWAANLDDLFQIDGYSPIGDVAPLGAGDWYFAHSLISTGELNGMEKYSQGYRDYWMRRQMLCERYIKKDVGVVPGLVLHDFHGHTVNRRYNTRENILIESQFDPYTDLKRDHNGVWQLEIHEPRQIKMYEQIRAYFRQRNEDQISH